MRLAAVDILQQTLEELIIRANSVAMPSDHPKIASLRTKFMKASVPAANFEARLKEGTNNEKLIEKLSKGQNGKLKIDHTGP